VSKKDPGARAVKCTLSSDDTALLKVYAEHTSLPLSTALRVLALERLREWSLEKREREMRRRKHAGMLTSQLEGP
jgi:hypothetical protein